MCCRRTFALVHALFLCAQSAFHTANFVLFRTELAPSILLLSESAILRDEMNSFHLRMARRDILYRFFATARLMEDFLLSSSEHQ